MASVVLDDGNFSGSLNQNVLVAAGLKLGGAGLQISGGETIGGDLDVGGNETVAGNLTVVGNVSANGNVNILGTSQLNIGTGAYLANQGTPNVLVSVGSVASLSVTPTGVVALTPLTAPSATVTGTLNVGGVLSTPQVLTGSSTVPGTIPNGVFVFLTDFNNAIATLAKPVYVVLSFVGTISPVNPSGFPSVVECFVVPPVNSGAGTGVVSLTGGNVANLGTQFRFSAPGGAGARRTFVEVACGAGGGYTIDAGSRYTWTIIG